jgi:hypothetical protein
MIVTESSGEWGTLTLTIPENRAPERWERLHAPQSGDVILIPDEVREGALYSASIGCVQGVENGVVDVCSGFGSAFLCENGSVSISGGPFFRLPLICFAPTFDVMEKEYWNWGPNGPGGGNGVARKLTRPVFRLRVPPMSISVALLDDVRDNTAGPEIHRVLRGIQYAYKYAIYRANEKAVQLLSKDIDAPNCAYPYGRGGVIRQDSFRGQGSH